MHIHMNVSCTLWYLFFQCFVAAKFFCFQFTFCVLIRTFCLCYKYTFLWIMNTTMYIYISTSRARDVCGEKSLHIYTKIANFFLSLSHSLSRSLDIFCWLPICFLRGDNNNTNAAKAIAKQQKHKRKKKVTTTQLGLLRLCCFSPQPLKFFISLFVRFVLFPCLGVAFGAFCVAGRNGDAIQTCSYIHTYVHTYVHAWYLCLYVCLSICKRVHFYTDFNFFSIHAFRTYTVFAKFATHTTQGDSETLDHANRNGMALRSVKGAVG